MHQDGIWNKMAPEDGMLLALITSLEKDGKKGYGKVKKDRKKKIDQPSNKTDTNPLTDAKRRKHKDARIPDWKKKAPTSDESKTKEINDKIYHWCSKCCQGQGQWSLHKESEHKGEFKPKKKTHSQSEKKKVSFQVDSIDKNDSSEPTVQVNKSILTNAKVYLAQFAIFRRVEHFRANFRHVPQPHPDTITYLIWVDMDTLSSS